MKLYAYWRSSSAWRVRIALNLKGIDHDIVSIDLLAGEHRSAEHLARSPLGQIPVLELDDGTCLTQNMAILGYLDAVAPHPRLIPADPLAAAHVWAMAEVVNAGTQPLQNMSVLNKVAAGGPGIKKGAKVTKEYLSGLDRDDWFKLRMSNEAVNQQLERAEEQLKERRKQLDERFEAFRKMLAL